MFVVKILLSFILQFQFLTSSNQKIMATTQKINANLWFDKDAEQAANFYTAVFKNSRIGKISRYGKEGFDVHKMPEGMVMLVEFWIEDQKFTALNGGPLFRFNE